MLFLSHSRPGSAGAVYRLTLVLLLLLRLCCAAPAQTIGSAYTLVSLRFPQGWTNPFAVAISQSGQLVGSAQDAIGNDHAFLWDPVTGLTELGYLPGGNSAWAYAINRVGQVVGVETGANGVYHPFIWSKSAGMADLGNLPGGGQYSAATGLNDLGQVVGWATSSNGLLHGFIWNQSTGMADLGVFPDGEHSYAHAINNAGQVIGWADSASPNVDSFLWSASTGLAKLSVPLGALGSAAYAMNDAGQVVGELYHAQATSSAFVWSSSTGMVDLGMPANITHTAAEGINSSGQVIGSAYNTTDQHTFIWSKATGMVDVGWSGYAAGINDDGQVAFNSGGANVYLGYPFALNLASTQIDAGKSTTGRVAIPFPATSNVTIPLTSDDSAITIPASVKIPAGKTSATFQITTTTASANNAAHIGAKYHGWSFQALLNIPANLHSMALATTTLVAGAAATGTVTLEAPAAADTAVTLSSNNSAATVSASVVVPAGLSTASFSISSDPTLAGSASPSIRASCGGVSKSAAVTVLPETVAGVTFSASSATAKSRVTGTVTMSHAAPSDIMLTLTGQTADVTFPASVTVAAGTNSATFPVRTTEVTLTNTVTVTATSSLNGASSSAVLTVQPIVPFNMAMSPWSVWSGQSSTLTVSLTSPAPSGGLIFTLSTSSPAAATFVSPTLTIAAGQTSGSAALSSSTVSTSTQVTVNAMLGTTPHNVQLTIVPVVVRSFDLSRSSITGGLTCTATLTLSAPAPSTTTVALASSDASATVPTTVNVPAGSNSVTFTVATTAVTATRTATLSATCGDRVKHTALRLTVQ